jgi:hypothetical protein
LDPKKTVHVVAHTHWDREWYLTREQFRDLLIDLVDHTLHTLTVDRQYRTFMLDGQLIALEDYLEIRPEERERIAALNNAGRLLIGPWYVLPDEVLISGEAHIRNYLIGQREADRLGGSMQCGYLPDSFGHPSQMPQILSGLGLREIVFWRGLGPDVTASEFRWEGPDGTTVLGLNMPASYGNGVCLPDESEPLAQRVRRKLDVLESKATTSHLLLMNGVDHVAPDATLPSKLCDLERSFAGYAFVHSNLPDYVRCVRHDGRDLQETAGELRSGYGDYLLGGTLSTRMYLKQANYQAEQWIERLAEPLSTMAWITGSRRYPFKKLQHLWKLHLRNLPHDSICGCSVDAVHDEMLDRYAAIRQLAGNLIQDATRALTAPRVVRPSREEDGRNSREGTETRGDVAVPDKASTADPQVEQLGTITVFNTLGFDRSETVDCTLDIDARLLRRVHYENNELVEYEPAAAQTPPEAVTLRAPDGSEASGRIRGSEEVDLMDIALDRQPEMYRVTRLSIQFFAKDIPSLGYTRYSVYPASPNNTATALPNDAYRLENAWLRVTLDSRVGTLNLEDKWGGRTFSGLAAWEDGGDAGDEYTYSPPQQDQFFGLEPKSIAVEWLRYDVLEQSFRLEGILRLPASLSEDRKGRSADRVACPVALTVTLHADSPFLELSATVTNRARDHRLRMRFPTGIDAETASAESLYSVEARGTAAGPETFADWVEPPTGSHPQKGFADVSDGSGGLAVLNRGLPEFEYSRNGSNGTISITLLRCVGWLSRSDLRARKGNGGWPLPTEGAQCLGEHSFSLALYPHAGSWQEALVPRVAQRFVTPPYAVSGHFGAHRNDDELPDTASTSYMTVSDPNVHVSAFKRAEHGEDLVVRLYNLCGDPVETALKTGFSFQWAYDMGLDETPGEMLEGFPGSKLSLKLGPWSIRTIGLRLSLGTPATSLAAQKTIIKEAME